MSAFRSLRASELPEELTVGGPLTDGGFNAEPQLGQNLACGTSLVPHLKQI